MISHEYKCIYIHIPKTAGTSVEKHFGLHNEDYARLKQDHRTACNILHGAAPTSLDDFGAVNFLRFINQRYHGMRDSVEFVSKRQFDEYFKFCFIRNPWDRAFSWYRNVIRDEIHQKQLGINKNVTLCEFLLHFPDQWALRPQVDWIVDANGEVIVDFIGKFENLEEDFKEICKHLNIEDVDLPMTLHAGHSSYVEAYDDKSRKIIANRYSQEIELFNYEFGK